MWMEVSEHRVRDAPQSCRERGLRGLGVGAYTQYLGINLLEVRVAGPERGDLVRSTACEREYVEREDDILLSSVLA
jgi:hypothetical protein